MFHLNINFIESERVQEVLTWSLPVSVHAPHSSLTAPRPGWPRPPQAPGTASEWQVPSYWLWLLTLSLQITPSFLEGLGHPPLGPVPSGHPFRPSAGSAYLF